MLNNFLCKIDGGLLAILILDIVLVVGVIGLFIWYMVRKNKKGVKTELDSSVERVNDDTYVLPNEETAPVEEPKVYEDDNAVLHFVNQITDINEEANNELNSTTVIVNHEVEQASRKIVKKDEIENFVMIGGEKKTKTDEEKTASVNRGTDAFKNATNFVNTIKTEQTVVEEEPKAKKKTTTKK